MHRSYSRKHCKKGYVSRRSYKKRSGTKVKAGCVKSRGLRSRGMKPSVYFPKLKGGSLTQYGYSVHNSERSRRGSLRKALKAHGYSKLIKKLNAVRVLSRNTSPKNSAKYARDIKYVQKIA